MKLITLNTWGGRAGKEQLIAFFNSRKDIDIFCLQEVWADSYEHMQGKNAGGKVLQISEIMTHGKQDISALLSDHSSYFRPHFLDHYGLMMLAHKNIPVTEEGEVFVYRNKGYIPEGDAGNHARNIQYITVEINGRLVTVINFHGLWNGKGKTDTEDRLQQSKNILDFIKKCTGEIVLCGDFNLLPDTESLQLFEKNGLRDLIKEYKVTSTRTSFYTKPEKYADYIFVSKGVTVVDFKVLPDEVSDHKALYLDFK